MGFLGSFVRLLVGIVVFIVVLALGIIFAPQLSSFLSSFPGNVTFKSGNSTVEIPVLASIVASVVLTLVLNLLALPFRRRSSTEYR